MKNVLRRTCALALVLLLFLALFPAAAFAGDPLGVKIELTADPEEGLPDQKVKIHYRVSVIHLEGGAEYTGSYELLDVNYRIQPEFMSWYSSGGYISPEVEDYFAAQEPYYDQRPKEIPNPSLEGDVYTNFNRYMRNLTAVFSATVYISGGLMLTGTEQLRIERFRFESSPPYMSYTCSVPTAAASYGREGTYYGPVEISWAARDGVLPYIHPYFSADGTIRYDTEGSTMYNAELHRNIWGSSEPSGTYSLDASGYTSISFAFSTHDFNLDEAPPVSLFLDNGALSPVPFPFDFTLTPDKRTYAVGDTASVSYHIGFPYDSCTCHSFLGGMNGNYGSEITDSDGTLLYSLDEAGYFSVMFMFELEDGSTLSVDTGAMVYGVTVTLGEITVGEDLVGGASAASVSYSLSGDLSQVSQVEACWYADGALVATDLRDGASGSFSLGVQDAWSQLRVRVRALNGSFTASTYETKTLELKPRTAVLPASLAQIGEEAFLNTALTEFYLPDGVTVGENAFPNGALVKRPEGK